jgi:sugar phosphate permease
VVWSAHLVVFPSRLCVGPLSPFLKESFHLSNAQIGGLTSATAITYALSPEHPRERERHRDHAG